MEYLMIFLLGIFVYNYVCPILEALAGCLVFKCISIKAKLEHELNTICGKQSVSAIGFDTSNYPDEEELVYDDEGQ